MLGRRVAAPEETQDLPTPLPDLNLGDLIAAVTGQPLTVTTTGSTFVRVSTSGTTLVIAPHARLGQLQDGRAIFAVGDARPAGTLAARAVAEIVQPRSGGQLHMSFRSCSPSAIAEALGG